MNPAEATTTRDSGSFGRVCFGTDDTFNAFLCALPTVHASWLDFLPEDVASSALASDLGKRVVTSQLLAKLGLDGAQRFELSPEDEWVARDGDALRRMALRTGAIASRNELRRLVDRARVLEVRRLLAEQQADSPPIPAVHGLPVVQLANWSTPDELKAVLESTGLSLMLDTLPAEVAIRSRVHVAFPKSLVGALTSVIRAENSNAIRAVLMRADSTCPLPT